MNSISIKLEYCPFTWRNRLKKTHASEFLLYATQKRTMLLVLILKMIDQKFIFEIFPFLRKHESHSFELNICNKERMTSFISVSIYHFLPSQNLMNIMFNPSYLSYIRSFFSIQMTFTTSKWVIKMNTAIFHAVCFSWISRIWNDQIASTECKCFL